MVLAEKRIDYDFVVARSQLAQALPEPRQAVRKIAATRAVQGHGAAAGVTIIVFLSLSNVTSAG